MLVDVSNDNVSTLRLLKSVDEIAGQICHWSKLHCQTSAATPS